MPTLSGSGTQLAVIGTEATLLTLTAIGTYVAFADLTNMATGDTLELRVYTKVLSSSTLNCLYYDVFTGVQPATGGLVTVSIPVPSDQQWRFTLKQIAGTGRNFDWKVLAL